MSTITKRGPGRSRPRSEPRRASCERLKAMQSVWILGVLIVIFGAFAVFALAPSSSPSGTPD